MENPKQTAYRFSYCLFAYLYKKIDIDMKFPLSTDYTVPSTSLFSSEIGECVLKIRSIFKPYLEHVILNDFPHICSEESLFEWTKWYKDSLNSSESFTFLKLMILCTLLIELVVYYFQKKCFYFTSSAPTVLSEILLSSQVLVIYRPLSYLFSQLKEFCNEILQNTNIYSRELSSILSQEAKNLENNSKSLLLKNQSNNFESFPEPKENEIPSSSSEQLTKLSVFQIQDWQDYKKTEIVGKSSESYDCKAIKLAVMTQKREDISCETIESVSSVAPNYFQDNDLTSNKSFLQPYAKFFCDASKNGLISNEQEYECDFYGCIEPGEYSNVDEFNPSNSFVNMFNTNITNSMYKPDYCDYNRKLCQYCNYDCIAFLSDFIDDFNETNYEVD